MARIVFGSYFVRYPLGGMMSHVMQYLVGFRNLGHHVVFVERAEYPDACFDPVRNLMANDCSYGVGVASSLLERFGLQDRWCFVDYEGRYYGLDRDRVERAFSQAEVFIDMGTHGAWNEEARAAGLRVLVDGEPGLNQIKMETGQLDPDRAYDIYFTNGRNVGTSSSSVPTAGRTWHHIFHPVVAGLFDTAGQAPDDGPFTTVMNWQSHEPIEYRDRSYGQKDIEFEAFIDLPGMVAAPLEVAVAGKEAPRERLRAAGWAVKDGQQATISFEAFVHYIAKSKGEFSVAKNVFVGMNTGWFSDRSAAYLAAGRPVVMQDTGFADHLPTGRGLFAVRTPDQAADAIDEICANPLKHEHAARRISAQYLDAGVVLPRMLETCGLDPGSGVEVV